MNVGQDQWQINTHACTHVEQCKRDNANFHLCMQMQVNTFSLSLCRRIHIHILEQMVSIRWGMHTKKCLCLTGIPWRLSLRCGMLFLSWDSGVLAWLPEGWSSARQRTDFSPLGIWLPWLLLQAPNRGCETCSLQSVSVHVFIYESTF